MIDENQIQREIERAKEAERLLGSTIFEEAFTAVTEAYGAKLLSSKPAEAEFRELMYHALTGAKLFRQQLEHHVTTGKMAQQELERIQNHKKGTFRKQPDPYGALA